MKAHIPRPHWKNFEQVPAASSGWGAAATGAGGMAMMAGGPVGIGAGAGLMAAGGIVDLIEARNQRRREERELQHAAEQQKAEEAIMAQSQKNAMDARSLAAENQVLASGWNQRHEAAHLAYGGTVPRYTEGGEEEERNSGSGAVGTPSRYVQYGEPQMAAPLHRSQNDGTGWNYNMEGNTASQQYTPSGGWDRLMNGQLPGPLRGVTKLASAAIPLGLSLYRPVLGSYLGMATSFLRGNPLGMAMNLAPSIYGTISSFKQGQNPFTMQGPYSNINEFIRQKGNIDPSTPQGRRNLLSGSLYLAPLIASWRGQRNSVLPTVAHGAHYY